MKLQIKRNMYLYDDPSINYADNKKLSWLQ